MDRDSLKVLLARGLSVESIARRFGKHPSTVSYWLAKHGLEANGRAKHAGRGGLPEDQLRALVEDGLTIAQIAANVQASTSTVRIWMRRYGLRTRAAVQETETRVSRADGLLEIRRHCARHGETEFVLEGRGFYRCKRCRQERVTQRRRSVKALLVAEFGGRCALCGYDRCHAALAFHHLEPSTKLLAVSADGRGYSIERLRREVSKCALLCANCHAEVEIGLVTLPIR